ncbi:TetR/AcrR family transcriptional regulator [Herbaspirillum sp. RTI4]|uniref:TetR/AcrR family transcriptional regulator n=1 Tax=Herbaspirillum sp. RTI4 TaxID=3048640 RepID=UPI002AB4858C|nr:TetR/AcrR family transcriptional regulator [Herbaspirillum sp. RTI4]MDY7579276.1 TetR/AcrR family transcriptional regulator [Herbaspirillum sp. RTI4]MEA9982775.1 TetR/AcrR family transcriptional regulator [Herbaspirillum sp. RTI4]
MATEYKDIRQHILDTGKTIIIGKGFAAVGLNEILSTAGVPKGSFYHYFKSKELFGEALLESYMADYLAGLALRLNQADATAAQRLMAYWDNWISSEDNDYAACQCLVVKLSGEVSDMSEPMRAALLRGTDLIVERLADAIRDGIADGSLQNPLDATLDATPTALTLYQMWLGAALLTKLRREPSALENARLATLRLLNLHNWPALQANDILSKEI